jgi:signal transduction histidine kinase
VTLADPAASAPSLRAACERVLSIGEQQERMIDSLLTLARSERGLERREPVLLDAIASEVLEDRREQIARRGLKLDATLDSAPTTGDPRLLERLVTNLIDNAIEHNSHDGWITIATGLDADEALVTVTNSGPVIASAEVERLLRPFQRLGAARVGHGAGHGLGLSIVAAIAAAHGASVSVVPRPGGGLRAEVRLAAGAGGHGLDPEAR